MIRHQLTDEQWDLISDLFERCNTMGRPPRDRRTMVNGILWILRTGSPWRDLPDEFGPWSTVWTTFDRWNADGTLDAVLDRLRAAYVDVGEVDDKLWCVDGTHVRAARCTSGGGKRGIPKSRRTTRLAVPAAV